MGTRGANNLCPLVLSIITIVLACCRNRGNSRWFFLKSIAMPESFLARPRWGQLVDDLVRLGVNSRRLSIFYLRGLFERRRFALSGSASANSGLPPEAESLADNLA